MKRIERTGVIRDFDAQTTGMKIGIGLVYAACIVIVILSLFPLVWAILSGLKSVREFGLGHIFPTFEKVPGLDPSQAGGLEGYIRSWKDAKFTDYYLNSLYSVIGSVICALVFNGLMAYGISILKPKGSKVLFSLVMFSMLIPATTSLVPLFFNIQRVGLTKFFWPLWLAAGANAFYVVLFKQFFDSFPTSIIEASQIDGCNSLQIFYKIVMPLSKPICVVVAIYAINGAWSDFLLPYLVLQGTDFMTVMVRLYEMATSAGSQTQVHLLRNVVFAIIPPVILFFVFQKQLTQNLVSSGIKG